MKISERLGALAGAAALSFLPALVSASPVSFDYATPAAGSLTAQFTVDVVGGAAQSGFGQITGTTFGTYNLLLLTATSTLSGNNGSINPTPGSPSYDATSGFTWHGVTGSGGADFLGDAVVNSAPNYLDDYGLIFALTDKSSGNFVGGINIFVNTNGDPSSLYATNLSVNGSNVFEGFGGGTLNLQAATVPEPSAMWLSLAALGALGFTRRGGKPFTFGQRHGAVG